MSAAAAAAANHTVRNAAATAATNVGELSVGSKTNAKTVRVGNYEVTVQKGEVLVKDLTNGKTVRVWGDPHVETSDGDMADFHGDNLTLRLKDGVKITFRPTPVDANGVSYLDQVTILKGKDAVVVGSLDPRTADAMTLTARAGEARQADRDEVDGTVLYGGDSLEQLKDAAGKEIGGRDDARLAEIEKQAGELRTQIKQPGIEKGKKEELQDKLLGLELEKDVLNDKVGNGANLDGRGGMDTEIGTHADSMHGLVNAFQGLEGKKQNLLDKLMSGNLSEGAMIGLKSQLDDIRAQMEILRGIITGEGESLNRAAQQFAQAVSN